MFSSVLIVSRNPSFRYSCQRLRNIRLISTPSSSSSTSKFWQWTTQGRPDWRKNVKEGIIACVIFGVTGTASALAVRPMVSKAFGIEGSWIDGPNSYRVVSVLCISPVYAIMLGVFGTLGGRHPFFAKMSMKILNRFFPNSLLSKLLCSAARNKKPM